jgi:hypothetical protein
MTTTDALDTGVPRDRYQRPLVVPPGGGKPIPYTRCTTYVGVLEDTYNLGLWQQRMLATGLASRPDLLLAVASTDPGDKKALDRVCSDAREAAAANAAATTGTALHALTERIDRGQPLGAIPGAYQADLHAYERATAYLTWTHIEAFTVHDDLKIGGTPDRVALIDGRAVIADVKTGRIDYGAGKIAMQLAVYAHSLAYDHHTGERTPLGDHVDVERAIVIHLPAGEGRCDLVEVDITAGWQAVQLATQVRAWRARKDLTRTITPPASAVDPTPLPEFDLDDAIATAPTGDALRALWAANAHRWGDAHTALARARMAVLGEH